MKKRRWRDFGLAGLMLGPSAAVLSLFVIYPLVKAVWYGHQRCDASLSKCRTTSWQRLIISAPMACRIGWPTAC